jgi:hypothetical protein
MPTGVYNRTEDHKKKIKEVSNRLEVRQNFMGNKSPAKRSEVRIKISERVREAYKRAESRMKLSEARKKCMNKVEMKMKVSTYMKKYHNETEIKERHRKVMLDGKASYMCSFIKNPSKPQVELFKLVQQISPHSILNYPSITTNYSIDIAIPQLSIAIEYDESYWHQDKEKDLQRQKSLEEEGWKFLRYRDYIPGIEQLKNDVNGLMVIKNGCSE